MYVNINHVLPLYWSSLDLHNHQERGTWYWLEDHRPQIASWGRKIDRGCLHKLEKRRQAIISKGKKQLCKEEPFSPSRKSMGHSKNKAETALQINNAKGPKSKWMSFLPSDKSSSHFKILMLSLCCKWSLFACCQHKAWDLGPVHLLHSKLKKGCVQLDNIYKQN